MKKTVRYGKMMIMVKERKKSYFVYLLRCADGTLYCGYTTDLERRVAAHNAGKGAKYTKARLPVELAWFEEKESLSAALSEECRIKRLSRAEKLRLLAKNEK